MPHDFNLIFPGQTMRRKQVSRSGKEARSRCFSLILTQKEPANLHPVAHPFAQQQSASLLRELMQSVLPEFIL